MRDLLGGKGANVAEMTRVLGAERVPAGFTITTEACVAYLRAGDSPPEGLAKAVDEALARLEEHAGRRLGDPEHLRRAETLFEGLGSTWYADRAREALRAGAETSS